MPCTLRRWIPVGLVIGILFAGTVRASAQTNTQPPPFSIRVTGEASVEVPPDQVEIDLGVMTRADTAQRAAADNAQRTAAVLEQVKQRAGPGAVVTTVGYSVQPEYRYPREGREPQLSGYIANNVVRVTSSDLTGAGHLIDGAVTAGANRVQRIKFSLKDEHEAYANALRTAATRARGEAEALASALGLTVGRVFSAVEESSPRRVVVDTFRAAAVAAEAAPTPVEPGTIEIDARVVLTVEAVPPQP